ncbi:MAG: SEL1-like repeat protein [Rhodospirillales bacterium]|nr:SEL1-like repeat protein [Rhodospirillales bacterium]
MRRIVLTAAFSFILATPAWAGFQQGWSAYYRGEYATALRELRPVAEQGHPAAQINLGIMYEEGQGVAQDYAEALKWFRRAARQDYAEGQFKLGEMYAAGKGVPQDHGQAIEWYEKAAAQRDTQAMIELGILYNEGKGTDPDKLQAFKWYRLAVTYLPPGAFRNEVIGKKDKIAVAMTRDQVHQAEAMAQLWEKNTQQTAKATAAPASAPARASDASIREVQEDLATLGYDPGPADGKIGPRTRRAIRAFESDSGLSVTGEISASLRTVLREERMIKTEGASGS